MKEILEEILDKAKSRVRPDVSLRVVEVEDEYFLHMTLLQSSKDFVDKNIYQCSFIKRLNPELDKCRLEFIASVVSHFTILWSVYQDDKTRSS